MSRLGLGILAALGCASAAFSQAAVEYALKSSGGALSASGGANLGGCQVDSALLACLSRSYPTTTVVVIGVLALLALRWLIRARALRS